MWSSHIFLRRRIFYSVFGRSTVTNLIPSWSSLTILTAITITATATGGYYGMNLSDCDNFPINSNNKSHTNNDENAEHTSPQRTARVMRKKTALRVAAATVTATVTKTTDSTTTTTTNKHNEINNMDESTTRSVGDNDNGRAVSLLRRLTTREQLSKLRVKEDEMLRRWEKDEDGWRELPARAWPEIQPDPQQLEIIVSEIDALSCNDIVIDNNKSKADHNNNKTKKNDNDNDVVNCTGLLFKMASSLVFHSVNSEAGLALYKRLARRGHIDSMVACGIILVEGLGVPPDEKEGFTWLEKAIQLDSSAQACYELGTMYYTGIDGVVEEDAEKAYELFERAAEQDHTAALYMTADCLVEGEGVEISVAEAIPLFYKAAERGHRFSRQRIRELLAQRDYPL